MLPERRTQQQRQGNTIRLLNYSHTVSHTGCRVGYAGVLSQGFSRVFPEENTLEYRLLYFCEISKAQS